MRLADAAYAALVRLLPSDFRAAFAAAMRDDFTRRLGTARRQGLDAAAWLTTTEIFSLLHCAASEWISKVTAPPFQRDMMFRDRSRMRPPGASKAFWYGDL